MIGGFRRAAVAPPAPTAPAIVVTSRTVTPISETEVDIAWTLSVASTGRVEYGTTDSYGSLSTLEPSFLASHLQRLTGLTQGTTYHYRVIGTSADGRTYTSSDGSFQTIATPSPNILISDISAIVDASNNVVWSWSVTPGSTGQVEYEIDPLTLPYANSTTLEPSEITAHVQGPYGPLATGTWHYRILATTTAFGGGSTATEDLVFVVAGGSPPPPPPPTGRTVVMIPTGTCDPTGVADVTTALRNFIIANASSANEITFQPNAIYKTTAQMHFEGINHIHLNFNAGEVFSTMTGGGASDRTFSFRMCNDLSIVSAGTTRGRVRGSHPSPGTFTFGPEHGHAFGIDGGARHLYKNIDTINVRGDGWYFSQWGQAMATDMTVEDCSVTGNGRMGVAVVAGNNILVQRTRMHNIAWSPFNIEPEWINPASQQTQGAINVRYLNNTITGWIGQGAVTGAGTQAYFCGTPHTTAGTVPPTVRDIVFADASVGSAAQMGMWVKFDGAGYRIANVQVLRLIASGTASAPYIGGPVYMARVDGAIIQNNHQSVINGTANFVYHAAPNTGVNSSGNTGSGIVGQ